MKFDTVKEAAQEWIREFDAVPAGIITKILGNNCDELQEITPPSEYDRVYITGGEYRGESGESKLTKVQGDKDMYLIEFDNPQTDDDGNQIEEAVLSSDDFEVERDDMLPMWSTLWSPPSIDQDWILGTYCDNHLQEVADCGFRIYEQEDYGLLLGIDGAGYDFYESHWIPLYNARGLQWHKTEG